MKSVIAKQKQEAPIEDTSKASQEISDNKYVINPQIQLDIQAFNEALFKYSSKAKSNKRMNIVAALLQVKHELKHNQWTCKVDNEIQQDLIEKEQDLLAFMRSELDCPSLFREFEMHIPDKSQEEKIPYTQEEKLKALAEKNPSLKRLQELFATRIIYT